MTVCVTYCTCTVVANVEYLMVKKVKVQVIKQDYIIITAAVVLISLE